MSIFGGVGGTLTESLYLWMDLKPRLGFTDSYFPLGVVFLSCSGPLVPQILTRSIPQPGSYYPWTVEACVPVEFCGKVGVRVWLHVVVDDANCTLIFACLVLFQDPLRFCLDFPLEP